MQIGSNNSLTYLKPLSWIWRLFGKFSKHQEVDYEDQYMYNGIRLFDIRLYTDDDNHLIIKNGGITYKLESLYSILDYLDRKGDATVLLTFDESYGDYLNKFDIDRKEQKFIEMCGIIERIYKGIRFCGGYRKFDKKVLYQFEGGEKVKIVKPEEESIMYSIYNKFFPLLTIMYHKYFIEKYKNENGFILLNYVNRKR